MSRSLRPGLQYASIAFGQRCRELAEPSVELLDLLLLKPRHLAQDLGARLGGEIDHGVKLHRSASLCKAPRRDRLRRERDMPDDPAALEIERELAQRELEAPALGALPQTREAPRLEPLSADVILSP